MAIPLYDSRGCHVDLLDHGNVSMSVTEGTGAMDKLQLVVNNILRRASSMASTGGQSLVEFLLPTSGRRR